MQKSIFLFSNTKNGLDLKKYLDIPAGPPPSAVRSKHATAGPRAIARTYCLLLFLLLFARNETSRHTRGGGGSSGPNAIPMLGARGRVGRGRRAHLLGFSPSRGILGGAVRPIYGDVVG